MPGYDEHQMIKLATCSQSQTGFCITGLIMNIVRQLVVESQAGLTNTLLYSRLIVGPSQ